MGKGQHAPKTNNTYIRNKFKGLYASFLMHGKLPLLKNITPLKKYYNPNSGGI